jgi:titin
MFVDTTPKQAPVFTQHLANVDKLHEGQHVTIEAQVEPRADPNLRVEWFKNGVSLTTGNGPTIYVQVLVSNLYYRCKNQEHI